MPVHDHHLMMMPHNRRRVCTYLLREGESFSSMAWLQKGRETRSSCVYRYVGMCECASVKSQARVSSGR